MTTRLDSRPVPIPAELVSALLGASQRISDALEERDRFIVEAHAAGGSLREIAVCVGLTHAGVRDILRRRS